MKKHFLKLVNLSLLSLVILSSLPPTASAQNNSADICSYANYQNGTVEPESFAGLPGEDKPEERKKAIDEANKRYADKQKALQDSANSSSFKNYVVVIAEEPLGPGNGQFSTNCARKITCSTGVYNPSTTSAEIQSCYSNYVTVNECSPSGDPNKDKEYVACEIVQIYVSPVGKSLLYGYVGQVYRYVAFIGGLIAVFVIIVAGIMWTSAGGNSEAISNAKAMMTRSLVGLAVLFLSALILYTINPNFFTLG